MLPNATRYLCIYTLCKWAFSLLNFIFAVFRIHICVILFRLMLFASIVTIIWWLRSLCNHTKTEWMISAYLSFHLQAVLLLLLKTFYTKKKIGFSVFFSFCSVFWYLSSCTKKCRRYIKPLCFNFSALAIVVGWLRCFSF